MHKEELSPVDEKAVIITVFFTFLYSLKLVRYFLLLWPSEQKALQAPVLNRCHKKTLKHGNE
jgi:hypothetical protein